MINIKKNYNCVLLVSSCDNYNDLWEPFFNLLDKYWDDCPFKIFLITETKIINRDGIETITAGINTNWSDRLKISIDHVKSKYVLLMLEDFFLQSRIDTEKLLVMFDNMKNNNFNMLRLIDRSGPNTELNQNNNYGVIAKETPFRVSTQASFWKSEVLLNLIEDNESIWEFEILGSKRANKYENFYAVIKPIFTYKHHVVERGEWFPWSAHKFKKMNIGVNLKKREIMNYKKSIYWILFKLLTPIYLKMPKKFQNFLSHSRNILENKTL